MAGRLFGPRISSQGPLYQEFAEQEDLAVHRQVLENMWSRFENLADSNFLTEFRRNMLPRFWESWLGCYLMDSVPQVEKVGNKGPDFRCKLPGGKIVYVEAVAPTKGDDKNQDKVGQPEDAGGWTPEDKVVLRLTSSLDSKIQKYFEYRDAGIIKDDEIYVIAITGGGIPHTLTDSDPSYIIRALFPIGSPCASIDIDSQEIVGQGYLHQSGIKKTSGSSVQKKWFRDESHSGLSSVIYSHVCPKSMFHPIRNFTKIVHNPFAQNLLPRRSFNPNFEYWRENDVIKIKKLKDFDYSGPPTVS